MFRRIAATLALALLIPPAAPAPARATGAWTNYMRMKTSYDVLALRDTVWIATGEAGLLRCRRSLGTFEAITREPGGLASNAINALEFDRSGQLWAATPNKGASRLSPDGSTWNLVNAFDGLPSDTVYALRAMGDSMWIGTQGGLALWDGTQIAGAVPDFGSPSPFRSNVVKGVVQVHDSLFVGTKDGVYVALISQHLTTWTALDAGLSNRIVTSMATDGHEVLVLTGTVVSRYSMSTQQWTATSGPGTVRLLRDDFGRMTCSSTTGLWSFSAGAWTAIPGAPTAGTGAAGELEFGPDPDGVYFAVKNGSLLAQASPAWLEYTPSSPADNDLQNVVVDGTRLWVATFGEGVSRLDGTTWTTYPENCCGVLQDTTFANPQFAFTLFRDPAGYIWLSSWGTAIERFDARSDPTHVERPLYWTGGQPDSMITHSCGWSSAADTSGCVYIGGDTFDRGGRPPIGIDVFGPSGSLLATWKTTNANLADNQVRAIAFYPPKNRMFVGYPGTGVSHAILPDSKATPPAMPTFLPLAGTLGADIFGLEIYGDTLWVLTTTNLKRFNAGTFSSQATLDLPGGPAPRGAVHPLAVSPNGTVWAASVDGVRRYNPGGGYVDYKTSNSPLANDEVRAITVDQATGVVWIGTAGGLTRFDPGWTPPPPPPVQTLTIRVWPNPAPYPAIGLDLKLAGNTTAYTGEIYDLSGRLVNRFQSNGNGNVVWDGRDLDGRRVGPGMYFVHAHAGGQDATARVVVLR